MSLKKPMLWLSMLLLSLLLAVPAGATTVRGAYSQATLVAENATIRPRQSIMLALTLTPDPGWHVYWKNPGDTGVATRLHWTLSPGAQADAPLYPTPTRLPVGDMVNFGYEGPATLLVALTAPPTLDAALSATLQLDWLVCSEKQCVPESATLPLRVPQGPGHPDAAQRIPFTNAWDAMPKPLPGAARYNGEQGLWALAVKAPLGAVKSAYFYPDETGILPPAMPHHWQEGADQSLLLGNKPSTLALPAVLNGVLSVTDSKGVVRGYTISAPRDPALSVLTLVQDAGTSESSLGLAGALGFALLGGVLLNFMPCVFPILSLKALALARLGGDFRAARREALAYGAGVLVMMALLGGLLLSLKLFLGDIGWGAQLQQPVLVLALALLMVLLGLNLAGLFEVRALGSGLGQDLTQQGGAWGAFWTGVLAVVIASPCTAPFMGAALGAAFVMPFGAAMVVFLALGVGMALPFVLIAWSPAVQRRLPRPGAWMETFRHFLAFPMLATALYLFWVLGRQLGLNAMALGLAAALLGSLALWLGRRGGLWRRGFTLLASVAALGLAFQALTFVETQGPRQTLITMAKPYSAEQLQAARAENRPVFVYFTADWCLPCKVNERGALASARVGAAFAKAGVTVLKADWTKGDPAITQALHRYGASGVPLYLWFAPGATKPDILPSILTPGRLLRSVP